MTSLADLGVKADMADLDAALAAHFPGFLDKLRDAKAASCSTGD